MTLDIQLLRALKTERWHQISYHLTYDFEFTGLNPVDYSVWSVNARESVPDT